MTPLSWYLWLPARPFHLDGATAISIIVSDLLETVRTTLIVRILSGIVTQYTGWRNVYRIALGFQYLIFLQLWLFMPD